MTDLNTQIEAGLMLEREGKKQEAIEYFRLFAKRYPDPRVLDKYARAIRYYTDEIKHVLN